MRRRPFRTFVAPRGIPMKLSILIICLFVLIGCDSSDVGATRVMTFKNIYAVDEQACRDRGLSPTRFSIEYPDHMEVEIFDNKRNHLAIRVRTGELILEELWIAETELTRPHRSAAEDWLKTFVKNYNMNSQGLEVEFMGEDNYNGENVHQIRGEVDYMSLRSSEYNGIYKIMLLLPFPVSNDSLTAVSITMIAHEYSEIKSLEDFETKGIVSKIAKTFRYLE